MRDSKSSSLSPAFIAVVVVVIIIFLGVLLGIIIWGGASQSRRSRAQRQVLATSAAAAVFCGPGQFVDDVSMCAPVFPAPLAFVGALMDARYTACDISFEHMMCGGAGDGSARALPYAQLHYRRAVEKTLAAIGSPWWRACTSARGTQGARRETAIEYRHVVERTLGDLYVDADLPSAWGRLTRAGYEGPPFALHRRAGQWYATVPGELLDRTHDMDEGRLYQVLQAGPITYNVVELQQRIGYLVEMAQLLYHHRSQVGITRVVRFADLPQRWPWRLYLGAISAPGPEELIICDDLPYLEWLLGSEPILTLHHWRAWLEFHVAQAHAGHVAASPEACLNLTLAMVPEIANAALLATMPLASWIKIEAETKQLAEMLRGGLPVSILPQRACSVQASMSPDRFDHNVNLVRAWRWAQEQTEPETPAGTLMLDWPLLQPPLYNPAYGDVSKYAIFGTHLFLSDESANLTLALARLLDKVWPLLPLTADRQHLFMVFAQAFCNTPGLDVDETLRATPRFTQVFGCHEGQRMYIK